MDLAQIWHDRLRELSDRERLNLLSKVEPIVIDGIRAQILASPFFINDLNNDLDYSVFIQATIKIHKYALANKDSIVFKRLYDSLTDGGRMMVDVCDYESLFSLENRFRRLDTFIDRVENKIKIIEMNQAAPLAISFYERARCLQMMIADAIDVKVEAPSLTEALSHWFIEEYEKRNGVCKKNLNIGLVVEKGYPAKFIDLPHAMKMIKESARNLDCDLNFIWCEPPEVKLIKGKVFCRNTEVDMIWRNTVYLDVYTDITDYRAIYSDQKNNLMLNSTLSWLTRSKEVFAILWNDVLCSEIGFGNSELKSIRDIIPFSFNPYYDSFKVDFDDPSMEWVRKPSDSGFGKGIVFSSDKINWDQAYNDACAHKGFIVQRRVEPITSQFSIIDQETGVLDLLELIVDYDPFVVGSRKPKLALVRGLPVAESSKLKKMNIVEGACISVASYF